LITITSRQILYLSEPLVPATGATSVTKNSNAFVINKGFELNITYDLIKIKI
jgi:hypothetical protein